MRHGLHRLWQRSSFLLLVFSPFATDKHIQIYLKHRVSAAFLPIFTAVSCLQRLCQGGSVAHLLALLSLREPAFEFWPPRFGIFLSARTTRHAAHAALLADAVTTPLPLPSLVIYGGNDGDVPAAMTRELMTTLDPGRTTEIYLPEGTHRIPKLSEEHRESVRAFLQAQQEAIAIAKESQA